jgi:hypothetical protein
MNYNAKTGVCALLWIRTSVSGVANTQLNAAFSTTMTVTEASLE